MRISLITDPDLVNSNYRAYQPLGALSRRGHKVEGNIGEKPILPHVLMKADVVHVHRIARPDMQQLVRQLRGAGVGIVWDNDDDVTAVPKSNPLYARFGGGKSRNAIEQVMKIVRLADVVTTPSEVLAKQYASFGATDVRVLENYLPREFADAYRPRREGIRIACLAALEHQIDYQQLGLRETLIQLLDEHPDLQVVSLGLGLGIPSDRYEMLKQVAFYDLAAVLAHADIGLAPLVDIPWNRARSNVKLKEYGAGGLAWLASPVGPYLGMGEEQGGRLVPDGGWHAAITRLIVKGRERKKLAKRAGKWAQTQGIEQHAAKWETVLSDAVERGRARRASAAS